MLSPDCSDVMWYMFAEDGIKWLILLVYTATQYLVLEIPKFPHHHHCTLNVLSTPRSNSQSQWSWMNQGYLNLSWQNKLKSIEIKLLHESLVTWHCRKIWEEDWWANPLRRWVNASASAHRNNNETSLRLVSTRILCTQRFGWINFKLQPKVPSRKVEWCFLIQSANL